MTPTEQDDAPRNDEAPHRLERTNGQRPLDTVPVVMFKDDIDVREVLKPSSSEFRNRWYTPGEYYLIKKKAMNTVRRMSHTSLKDDDHICTRGLEIVDEDALKIRKRYVDSTVQRVLKEQDQRGTGAEEISEIYREISTSAVQKSIQTAHDDAKDAENYQENKRSKTRTRFSKVIKRMLFVNRIFKGRSKKEGNHGEDSTSSHE